MQDAWAEYFEKLCTTTEGGQVDESDIRRRNLCTKERNALNRAPLRSEVENGLQRMATNKATGIDNMPGELLKKGGEAMYTALTKLFQII